MSRKRQSEKGRHRISLSLPGELLDRLDAMSAEQGFHNRSQAFSTILEKHLDSYASEDEQTVMAGAMTLIVDTKKSGLLQKLRRIQREHVSEVISAHDIFLEGDCLMEVLLVQGPVSLLRRIMDRLRTCKGVISSDLVLTSKILPPVHGRTG